MIPSKMRIEDYKRWLTMEYSRLNKILEDMDANLEARFRKLFSDPTFDFRKDYHQTVAHLDDSRADVRRAAIWFLLNEWTIGDSATDICEKIRGMSRADEDEQVRAVALSVIGSIYAGSRNAGVLREAAAIVMSGSESDVVRETAYGSLFVIFGLPVASWPLPAVFRFPDDVDWDLVRKASEVEGQ